MIQYQYFHTPRGYVTKTSMPTMGSSVEMLFGKLRSSVADSASTFTYATVGTQCVFMQSTKLEREMYIKGIFAGDIFEYPAKYINTFQTEVREEDKNVYVLQDEDLPPVSDVEWGYEIAETLSSGCLIPKLIDALLYDESKKQIVVIAKDKEDAANYMRMLSLLLPQRFLKRVGFSIGSRTIPNVPMKWPQEGGAIDISIRIWFPELLNFDYGSYCNYFYVFDIAGERDNYDRQLSPVAQLLSETNLADAYEAEHLAQYIADAFRADGTVDIEMLERRCLLIAFDRNREDYNVAKKVIRLGMSVDEDQNNAVMTAVDVLLIPENYRYLTPEDRMLILNYYKQDAAFAERIRAQLFEFYFSSIDSLSNDEKFELTEMIAEDMSGDMYSRSVAEYMSRERGVPMEAFKFALTVLLCCFSKRGTYVYHNEAFVRSTMNSWGYDMIRGRISVEEQMGGENIFTVVADIQNEEYRNTVAAILMASVYTNGVSEEGCNIRIRGLKRMISELRLSAIDTVKFIVSVRDKMMEVFDNLQDVNLGIASNSGSDFIFNTQEGAEWITGIINTMPMDAALYCNTLVRNATVNGYPYQKMIATLRDRLLNVEFVKAYVRCGSDITENYNSFFRNLPAELQDSNMDIAMYLDQLGATDNHSLELSKYRCDFVYKCFVTMSHSDVEKVKRNGGLQARFNDLAKPDRIRSVEATSKVFSAAQRKRARKHRLGEALISSFIFGIIAYLVIALFAYIANVTVMPYFHLLLAVAVSLVNFISYKCLRDGNILKRAAKITLCFGIVPLVIFIAVVFFLI